MSRNEAKGQANPPPTQQSPATGPTPSGTEKLPAESRPTVPNLAIQIDRQRTVLVNVVRLTFVVIFLTVLLLSYLTTAERGDALTDLDLEAATRLGLSFFAALVLAGVALTADLLTPTKKISTLVSIFVGLLAATLGSLAVGAVIDLLARAYDIEGAENVIAVVKVLIGICLAYLAISTVLQTQDDFRLIIPYVEFSKQIRGPRPVLLDTSVLIDGRIVDVARTGLVQSPMVVPDFVVAELQSLSDSADKSKRERGRRGLDILSEMLGSSGLDVTVEPTRLGGKGVDQLLIELAIEMPAAIATGDSGLTRTARMDSVVTINLHELAGAMRPRYVAGDQFAIKLERQGEQPGQAVGFLEDGGMVVVNNAADLIGQRVEIEVTSTLQTSAGRLAFASLAADVNLDAERQSQLDVPSATPESLAETASSQPRDTQGPATTDGRRPKKNRQRNPRR